MWGLERSGEAGGAMNNEETVWGGFEFIQNRDFEYMENWLMSNASVLCGLVKLPPRQNWCVRRYTI